MTDWPGGEDILGSRRRRWGGIAFLAFVAVLLAVLALWFGSEYSRLGSSETTTHRAYERQLLISELFSSIKDAETGQRGYILTGSDAFLEPYREGKAAVRRQFAKLQVLPTSRVEQLRIDRMQNLVELKIAEMEEAVEARQSQGLTRAAEMVSEGRGKRLMDKIRLEVEQARAAEAGMLSLSLAYQNERTKLTQRIIWIVVAWAALTLIVMAVAFWRGDSHRDALVRHALESAERRRAIFTGTLDAIVLINPSGSIETINPAAAQLFGYGEDDLVRRDISLIVDLAPGEGPFLDRVGLKGGRFAEPFRHRLLAQRGDGITVPVEAALGVMSLPDGDHIVAAFRDISEREKSERIKDQFLSTVSHELRTPLTSIVGSLGLLRGGINGDLAPGVQRLVVIAENNANRLIRLVNDLLDIEKFESGAMSLEFEPIDLRDTAAKALDAVRGLAGKHEVELALGPAADPVMVRGDSDRLVQVMTNLLANAVRFTPPGRSVTLAVKRRAAHAEASVTDEGPGIDDELKARLFNRFAQSIQTPSGTGARGTGLGLAISREIVRGHGGSIWHEPAAGGGSVFAFNLPLWNVLTGQHDHDGAPRVMICADEGDAAMIVGALENRSIRADVADDSAGLVRALKQRRYLAVLLDCNCPHAPGIDLLQEIRADPALRGLPIIAIVSSDGQEAAKFATLNLVDWMPRPLDPARLNEALTSVMDRTTSTMPLVLHVDDDTDTLEITSSALAGRARMARATDIASARAFIAGNRPDVVIVDLALPDGSGAELITDFALPGSHAPPVIIYSAQDGSGTFGPDVSAVLTKSKRSLSALVETIIEILDRQEQQGHEDGR